MTAYQLLRIQFWNTKPKITWIFRIFSHFGMQRRRRRRRKKRTVFSFFANKVNASNCWALCESRNGDVFSWVEWKACINSFRGASNQFNEEFPIACIRLKCLSWMSVRVRVGERKRKREIPIKKRLHIHPNGQISCVWFRLNRALIFRSICAKFHIIISFTKK